MTPIETHELNGCTIELHHDGHGDTSNPLEDYGGGVKLILWMRNRGSDHGFKAPEDVERHCRETGAVAFKVRGYSHGSLGFAVYGTPRANSYPFTCPFDSGFAGYLLFEREEIEMRGWKRLNAQRRTQLREIAEGWVREYEAWTNGEAYGYVIKNADGEHVESGWGFIGDSAYALESARAIVNDLAPQAAD